jgi:hypothetical protein
MLTRRHKSNPIVMCRLPRRLVRIALRGLLSLLGIHPESIEDGHARAARRERNWYAIDKLKIRKLRVLWLEKVLTREAHLHKLSDSPSQSSV